MFSRIIIFVKCYWDYLKYKYQFKRTQKIDNESYNRYFQKAKNNISIQILKPISFHVFRYKWLQRNCVLDMDRLKYLANTMITRPLPSFPDTKGVGLIEDFNQLEKESERNYESA